MKEFCAQRTRSSQLYRSGYLDEAQQDRDISEYAYKRGAASLLDYLDAERSYRATQLAYRQALAAYLTGARTASRSSWNKESAMKISRNTRRACGLAIVAAMGAAFVLAGCSSSRTREPDDFVFGEGVES